MVLRCFPFLCLAFYQFYWKLFYNTIHALHISRHCFRESLQLNQFGLEIDWEKLCWSRNIIIIKCRISWIFGQNFSSRIQKVLVVCLEICYVKGSIEKNDKSETMLLNAISLSLKIIQWFDLKSMVQKTDSKDMQMLWLFRCRWKTSIVFFEIWIDMVKFNNYDSIASNSSEPIVLNTGAAFSLLHLSLFFCTKKLYSMITQNSSGADEN